MLIPSPRGRLNAAEIELLRALANASREPEGALSDCDTEGIRWPLLFACAHRHRLNGILHEALRRNENALRVPTWFRTRLEDAAHVELAKAVLRLHHLDEVASVAAAKRMRFCLLKGAAFAGTLYAHPTERPMADLDVLVEPGHFLRWIEELEARGYRLEESADHAACFRHRGSGVYVEAHRALTACSDFLGIATEALFERSRPAPGFESEAVRTLAWEDHLLHLCLHASFQHGFRQPAVNAWDAHSIARLGRFDVEAFSEKARTARLARWVYAGLSMADAVFPAEGLYRARKRLEASVPGRLLRWARRLRPDGLLAPDRDAVFGPPLRRLSWAGGLFDTLSLVLEISRPPSPHGARREPPSIARMLQLTWNHGVQTLSSRWIARLPALTRPTHASLGEVRDV